MAMNHSAQFGLTNNFRVLFLVFVLFCLCISLHSCGANPKRGQSMDTQLIEKQTKSYFSGSAKEARQSMLDQLKMLEHDNESFIASDRPDDLGRLALQFSRVDLARIACFRLYAIETRTGDKSLGIAYLMKGLYWGVRAREIGGMRMEYTNDAFKNAPAEILSWIDKYDKEISGGATPNYLKSLR